MSRTVSVPRSAPTEQTYSPFIHLSVAVVQSASDMIEEIGVLKGIRRASANDDHAPWQMDYLRKAIQSAADALASYDALVARSIKQTTGDEFKAAAKHGEAV